MANMCYNYVEIRTTPDRIQDILAEFRAAQDITKTGEGWLPEGMPELKNSLVKNRYWFDIDINEDDGDIQDGTLTLFCTSRWAPPLDELEYYGKLRGVDIAMQYDESGNNIFGKAIYSSADNSLTDICLEDSDFGSVEYDGETGIAELNGEEFDSDTAAYSSILEQKLIDAGLESWSNI